jgi:predicted transcriptional regulator
MAKRNHGKTAGGEPITDRLVEKLAAEAEAGYDVEEIVRRRPGRPSIGSAPARVESVRLDPELRQALSDRADREGSPTSAVIREALRLYLSTPAAAVPADKAGGKATASESLRAGGGEPIGEAPRSGKRWSRTEERELRRLVRAKAPTRVIATRLGRSEAGIAGKAEKLALTLSPGKSRRRKRRAKS